MSELKVHRIIGLDERCNRVDDDYYLKSDVDKKIAELQSKARWLELAEKFKETK